MPPSQTLKPPPMILTFSPSAWAQLRLLSPSPTSCRDGSGLRGRFMQHKSLGSEEISARSEPCPSDLSSSPRNNNQHSKAKLPKKDTTQNIQRHQIRTKQAGRRPCDRLCDLAGEELNATSGIPSLGLQRLSGYTFDPGGLTWLCLCAPISFVSRR